MRVPSVTPSYGPANPQVADTLLRIGMASYVKDYDSAATEIAVVHTDSVLATQFRHGRVGLGLLEYGDDLAVGETDVFMEPPRGKGTRKYHFWRQLICGGLPDE